MRIDELRVSFVFGETVLGPLAGVAGPVPTPCVVERGAYIARFDAAQDGDGSPARPWLPHGRQGFWEPYLDAARKLRDVKGARAFANLVPLRFSGDPSVTVDVPGARVTTELFAYPWGTALVVTVMAHGGWTSAAATADAAVELRNAQFDTATIARLPLPGLAEELLERAREEIYGDVAGRVWTFEPFSIATVIDGEGPLEELHPRRPEIRTLLHALSTFSPTWGDDVLDDLSAHHVAGRRTPIDGHEIYGTRRGRTVWGPHHFVAERGRVHTLGCQHRNLVHASMQTESLAALVLAARARLDAGQPLGALLSAEAKLAIRALDRFHRGVNTYRSGSVRAQIEQNEWVDPVNALAARLAVSGIA